MTLPTRYTINGVPWGDCACCDMAKCVWHTDHPDRDPPSRPTTAALVEKIERLYIRTLEENVRELTSERDAAFAQGAEAMRTALLQRVSWGSDLADRIRNEPVPERAE